MSDLLIERLRDHVDAEPVPDLDLTDVIRLGRRVRRRRSVARRSIATLVVGAIAGTALVGTGRGGDAGLDSTTTITSADARLVSSAYRTGGAFSRGTTLWFSDPDYSVDLGVTIQLMYYTAHGVVAGVTNDDDGSAKRDYVYVGTGGTVRQLDLPGKVVPGADAMADRFAYVTKRPWSDYQVHVVEASTGRELAQRSVDADYSWAGWDLPPISLTGQYVVLGVDGAQRVIDWRTGERVADVPGVQMPSTGGGRALGGADASSIVRLGDSRELASTADLTVHLDRDHSWSDNELSPDGRFVRTANTDVRFDQDGHDLGTYDSIDGHRIRHPVVQLTEVETGRRTTLPGTGLTYGWTPDGRLLKVSGSTVTTCDASSTSCTSRTMPTGPGAIRLAGVYNGA